ncbi:MAG TPA: DUF192 domain-containing protein [Candidatus Binatia bacterium]|jgi:hypothetical protein|nr:DUF192 domain-containing protein [Candidatus Binatia bacterium]
MASFLRSSVSPFLLFALWLFSACASAATPQVVIHPQKGEIIRVSVEIADTPQKRSFGLMYRRDLPESHGMLFLFPREELLSFWMKNTPLPLDIIFINVDHTIVSIAQDTTPFSEKPLPSGSPAKFVLEVNGGFCRRHGVTVGDRVEFTGALPSAS